MNLHRKSLIWILVFALVVAATPATLARPSSSVPCSPLPVPPFQGADPAVEVQVYLESQGYTVRRVSYDDQDDTAVVVMDMVSNTFDAAGREQIVQGWYALARAYTTAQDLWSAVVYREQYTIVFQVKAQDFRDWVDGKIAPSNLHYVVQVYDSSGRLISDKDFIHKNFTGTTGSPVQPLGALPKLRFPGLWLIYRDDFSDPLSEWEVSQEGGGSAGYANGVYRLTMAEPQSIYWAPAPGKVREFAFSAKAMPVSGDASNIYGLIFSYLDDDNLCAFFVTAEGHYTILQMVQGEGQVIQSWTASNALKQGQLPNLLRVEVQEDEVRVFANGQVLTAATVSSLQKGKVGLAAGTLDHPPTEVLFDDVALFGVQKDWRAEPGAAAETHAVQPLRREAVPAAGRETLQALAMAEPPALDSYARSVRTGEIPPDTPRTLTETPSYQVGDTETLYAGKGEEGEEVEVKCKLVVVTPGVYVWVEEGQPYNKAALKAATDLFDTTIAPKDRAFFGSEWTPGMDNDARIHILNWNAARRGLCGYFQSANEYPRAVWRYSNQREMLFMNALGPNSLPPGSRLYRATLAHEFQHLINWSNDPNEETWLNEGCSMLAEYLNGYPPDGYDVAFSRRPDAQLDAWEYMGDPLPHYGNSYLFMTYFLGRFGQDAAQTVATDQANGTASFAELLKSRNLTFDDVFDDWVVALYVNDKTLGSGRYAFPDGVDATRPRLSQAVNRVPADELTDVHQYAADYIKLNPGLGEVRGPSGEQRATGDVRVNFTGSTVVPIGPGKAHSGQRVWWFGWGDSCDATLTREFDLSAVSKATLQAAVWYNTTRGDLDVMTVTVMVSADGGQTWQVATSASGRSGGGEEPAWKQASIDLSKWAGQKVQVRFEAIAYLPVDGFALDEVSIPEIDYQYDPDEGAGGWQAAGFVRVVPVLPQRYTVQVIEFDGKQVMAVRRMELDDTNRGQIAISGLAGNKSAVLVVAAHTPYTERWASYEYQVTAQ